MSNTVETKSADALTRAIDQVPYFRDMSAKLAERFERAAAGKEPEDAVLTSAMGGAYSTALEQIYTSRDAFFQTAQSAQTTLLLFYTAGAALVGSLLTYDHRPAPMQIIGTVGLAATCFLLPLRFRDIWREKVLAGYNLYIAATIHAAVVLRALDCPLTHHWLEDFTRYGNINGTFKSVPTGLPDATTLVFTESDSAGSIRDTLTSSEQLMAIWRSRPFNLYLYYKELFDKRTCEIACAAMLTCAIVLFVAFCWPEWMFPNQPKV